MGETSVDPYGSIREEGNIINLTIPIRMPCRSKNVAECIGYTNKKYNYITSLLDAI